MSDLKAFLRENVKEVANVKYVASKRIIDKKNPVEWEIRCITNDENDKLRDSCTKEVRGRKGIFRSSLNTTDYLAKMAVRCTVYPDLNDAALQDSYGVKTPEALLKKILNIAEYQDYVDKIQEVNGFDLTFEDKVDEVKN